MSVPQEFYKKATQLNADLARLRATMHPLAIPDNLTSLEVAIAQAVHFLARDFRVVGCWTDFGQVVSGGRDWITGYVGWSLLSVGENNSETIHQAGVLLERDRYPSGGWGYRPGLPVDADSTSWAILFLRASGYPVDLSPSAKMILAHQNPIDGGIRSYPSPDSGIQEFIQADASADLSGWCSSHLCVTGAAVQALHALGFPAEDAPVCKALAFIRRHQTEAGYWNSYWYHSKIYGTAQAVRVLCQAGDPNDSSRLTSAREWLEGTQLDDGSWSGGTNQRTGCAVDTALAIRALLDISPPPLPRIQHGIDWLLQQQCPDGSWGSTPILRIPQPSEHTPWLRENWPNRWEKGRICVPDSNRFFTTATVLQALAAWKKIHLATLGPGNPSQEKKEE